MFRFLAVILMAAISLAATGLPVYAAQSGFPSVEPGISPGPLAAVGSEGLTGVSNPGDTEGDEEDDDEGPSGTRHVAQAIAAYFGLTTEQVLAVHEQGIGYGNLVYLLLMADATGSGLDNILSMRGEGLGWGKIRKVLEWSPGKSETTPGRIVSEAAREKAHSQKGEGEETEEEGDEEESGSKGKVPPGQTVSQAAKGKGNAKGKDGETKGTGKKGHGNQSKHPGKGSKGKKP
ncbi:MAG: hypothetical protein ACE5NP_00100 [Anaerolineae bacterium]